jgi:phage tail sheath protein FI
MATSYLSPGVYVEEVDRGTKPIEGVGTSVAAFIGFTELAAQPAQNGGGAKSLVNQPVLVTNWEQFKQKFGGFVEGAYLPHAVYGYFANGGGRCYVISLNTLGASDDPARVHAAQAALPAAGDGKNESLLLKARAGGPGGNDLAAVIQHANSAAAGGQPADGDSFVLTVQRGNAEAERFEGLTLGAGEHNVETVVNTRSKLIQVEIAGRKGGKLAERRPAEGRYALQGGEIMALAVSAPEFAGDASRRQGIGGLEALDDVTMVAVPDLMSAFQRGQIDLGGIKAVQTALLNHCEHMKYRFAILDAPPDLSPQQVTDWRQNQAGYDSKYGALYYPWISVANPLSPSGGSMLVPPSGHVAGVYARSDSQRGVHKAPANEVVSVATGLAMNVTKEEQEGLNPIGVNCIRSFPGRGIRIWGARTLSGSDPAWRYVNVRRLFNYVEASIERGTHWVVFEPNDQDLWARVRRDVSAFLRLVWRSGALFGTTPEEAFYVKCDETINPPEVRDAGQLIIEIGLAPVKPAEFVIFRIGQWTGPNAQP